jgi:hypothetical protein
MITPTFIILSKVLNSQTKKEIKIGMYNYIYFFSPFYI